MKQVEKKQDHTSRMTFKRSNPLMMTILKIFWHIGSYPRLIIECFFRTDFGERYFSFYHCIVVYIALAVFPFVSPFNYTAEHWYEVILYNPIWYGFLGLFIYFSNLRRLEIKRNPKGINFEYFTLCVGYPHPKIEAFLLEHLGKLPSHKVYEIILEPLVFFIAGLLLLFFDPILAKIFIVCALCYSGSYLAAYEYQRHEWLDLTDNAILTEQTKAVIVEGRSARYAKGVRFLADKPTRDGAAARLADLLTKDDDEAADVI